MRVFHELLDLLLTSYGGPAELLAVLSYAAHIYFLQWYEVLGLGSWSKKKVLHHKIADMHSFNVVYTEE